MNYYNLVEYFDISFIITKVILIIFNLKLCYSSLELILHTLDFSYKGFEVALNHILLYPFKFSQLFEAIVKKSLKG